VRRTTTESDATPSVRYSTSNLMSTNRVFVVGRKRRRDVTWHDRLQSIFHVAARRRLSFNFDAELYRAGADLLTRVHDRRHDGPRSSISHVIVIVRAGQLLSVRLSVCSTVHSQPLSCTRLRLFLCRSQLTAEAPASHKPSNTLPSVTTSQSRRADSLCRCATLNRSDVTTTYVVVCPLS